MIDVRWQAVSPTELRTGQRVRQTEFGPVGTVTGWRYRRDHRHTVVDVRYQGGQRTQWLVVDGDTVQALPYVE